MRLIYRGKTDLCITYAKLNKKLERHSAEGHIVVFPDILGTVRQELMGGFWMQLALLESQIADNTLRKRFHSFRQCVQKGIEINEQVVQWLAEFAGFKSVQEERNRRRLQRKLARLAQEAVEAGEEPEGNWVRKPGYWTLVKKALQTMIATNRARQRIERRLGQLWVRCWEIGALPSSINEIVESICVMAEALHYSQSIGCPDILGTAFRPCLMMGLEIQKNLEYQTSDGKLERLHSFEQLVQRLLEIDERMVKQLMESNGLLSGPEKSNQVQLCRKLARQTRKTAEAGEFPPNWVMEPEYRALLEESSQAISAIVEAKTHITRIDVPTAEEFGDQQAKDLIDKTEGEEPRQAIKLLQRALRYGRTGIQASKAYKGLGMSYEDLGDDKKAIEYYTKSMEAWRPDAITLFWRGKLYYSHGELAKARADFEASLAFSSRWEHLTSPEREEAERYLAELRQAPEKPRE